MKLELVSRLEKQLADQQRAIVYQDLAPIEGDGFAYLEQNKALQEKYFKQKLEEEKIRHYEQMMRDKYMDGAPEDTKKVKQLVHEK